MFGTIRKHQTWLWAVIITLTIISFVSFLSPNSKMNAGRGSDNYGSINGERVTRIEKANAYREVDLHILFMSGHWLSDEKKDSRVNPELETYRWLLLAQLQRKLGIHVGDDAAASMAQQMIHSFERMGITSPAMFIERVLQPHGYGVDDFERYIRHFVGVQELISTFGLSGRLITPQEAKALYDREHQELATEAVFFPASNYLASVSVSPEALGQFYSNRLANYIIPERVQVSYVRFNVTNYLAQAETELGTNLTELIEANYQRMGTNYFTDAKTPDEVKAKIRQGLIRNQAMKYATKNALEFANVLFDLKPFSPDQLQKLAATNGVTASVTAPFSRDEDPKDLEVGADFSKAAFALTPDEPYAGPISGQDGVYVISYDQQLPRETPSLDQVRDKVMADFKHSQAMMQAQLAGRAAYQSLTNGLAQGKSFTNLCAEAHLQPTVLPPFSISTRAVPEAEEMVNLTQLKQLAFSTPPGQVSPYQPTLDGGLVLYVKSKLPLDESKATADLPSFVANLRRTRQQEAFEDWFRKEAEHALQDTPVGQQKAAPTLGSAAARG
ncbi:MAG TPA: peptidyl-prolyl cis-trans isomerase [Verrucomicrobiae bacterium]|nr:peptidyl-prolyl cis-trans isomerase [Verrucomicrobiae bacterium]